MSQTSLADRLEAGLQQLGIDLSAADCQAHLLHYLDLLQRWNRSYNLTAIRDPREMVTRHLLDSLSVLPWIESGRLLDAGTGAGLPGVPLAICRPQLELTLLDSAGKKIRFLNHVRRELGLSNAMPVQQRLEQFVTEQGAQQVISRAFSSLADFVAAARHLGAVRLLAMKGKYPREEIAGLPTWVEVESVEKLAVPGLQEDRHLVIMSGTDEA